jgi:signal transduction histidine kinase
MDFAAIASHELRTLLSVILGCADFLKENAWGETSELATAVLSSALQPRSILRSIIESMTSPHFLQRGALELVCEDVPAARVARMALGKLQGIAQSQRLTSDLTQDAPIRVDRLKLAWRSSMFPTMASNSRRRAAEFPSAWNVVRARCGFAWQVPAWAFRLDLLDKIFDGFFELKTA